MKKIYISEKQLKSILGEDFVSYLDKSDNGNDFPKDSIQATSNEVLTTEPGGEPKTLDNVGAERVKNHPFFRKATYGTYYESVKKKELNERSEKNNNLKITPNKSAKIDKDEKGVRLNTIEVRLHRMKEKLKTLNTGSEEYNNTRKKISALEQSVKRGSNMASALDTMNTEQEIANVNSRTGVGHHNKNTIYYENN